MNLQVLVAIAEVVSASAVTFSLIALIVSKIILVIIFVIGVGVLTNGVGEAHQTGVAHVGQTVTQIVIGVMVLVMAGFAPWLAIKLVHFAGDSFHAVHASAGSVR